MTAETLYAAGGVGLLALGLYGAIVVDDRIRRVLTLNIMGTGVFMILIALAARSPSGRPDPVLHAMVLTGIVVAVSASGFAVALACRLGPPEDETRPVHDRAGEDDER